MPTNQNKNRSQTVIRRPGVPRNKFKSNSGGDSSTFTSQYMAYPASTGLSQFYGYVLVNPANHGPGTGVDPGSTVVKSYQEYLVNSDVMSYTPAVGTTTPGTMWLAYVDNPEIIFNLPTYSYAQYLGICQTTRINKSCPVWERMDLASAGPPRRKMFSVDTTSSTNVANEDRVTQGAFVFASTDAPVSTRVGYFTERYVATVKGLQNSAITGI